MQKSRNCVADNPNSCCSFSGVYKNGNRIIHYVPIETAPGYENIYTVEPDVLLRIAPADWDCRYIVASINKGEVHLLRIIDRETGVTVYETNTEYYSSLKYRSYSDKNKIYYLPDGIDEMVNVLCLSDQKNIEVEWPENEHFRVNNSLMNLGENHIWAFNEYIDHGTIKAASINPDTGNNEIYQISLQGTDIFSSLSDFHVSKDEKTAVISYMNDFSYHAAIIDLVSKTSKPIGVIPEEKLIITSDEDNICICTEEEITIMDMKGVRRAGISFDEKTIGSMILHENELFVLTNEDRIYRYSMDGRLILTYEGDNKIAAFLVRPSVKWHFTDNGFYVWNNKVMEHFNMDEVKCSLCVDNTIMFDDVKNDLIVLEMSGDDPRGFGRIPIYSPEEMMKEAETRLNGLEMSEEEKHLYGINE